MASVVHEERAPYGYGTLAIIAREASRRAGVPLTSVSHEDLRASLQAICEEMNVKVTIEAREWRERAADLVAEIHVTAERTGGSHK